MKIVGTDNLASETVSDHTLVEGLSNDVQYQLAFQLVCDALNRGLNDGPGRFYQLLPDDFRPYKYEI